MSAEKTLLGKNLKILRLGNEWDQAQLAEKAGISRGAYQKIERGESIPRVDTLLKLANVLGVELTDLVKDAPELSAVRFRSQKKLKGRDYILFRVARWLSDFNQLEELLDERRPFRLAAVHGHIQKMDATGLERAKRAAAIVRSEIGLERDQAVVDVCGLLEETGVKVLSLESQSDGFYGLSVAERDGGPAVVVSVSERLPVERWIFSSVHEFGHILLHMDSFEASQTTEEDSQEKEANVFASHFLMPDEAFQRYVDAGRGCGLIDWVLMVKRAFLVSYKTVLMRLLDMQLVDGDIWRRFNELYRKRFGKKLGFKDEPSSISPDMFWSSAWSTVAYKEKEPKSLDSADFSETWLSNLVRRAYERDLISLGKAAEILRLDRSSMMDLAAQWRIWVWPVNRTNGTNRVHS